MSTSLSSSILRSREVDFLTQERRLAQELGDCLRAFESSAEDNETLRLVTQALQEPFLLVIAGEFDARTRELSETLSRTLREQFNREIASGKQRLEESLAPYTRFVRIESERVAQVKETLESLRAQARDLRQRIDGGDSAMGLGERAAPTQPRSRSAK
jgi:hypothetical protein